VTVGRPREVVLVADSAQAGSIRMNHYRGVERLDPGAANRFLSGDEENGTWLGGGDVAGRFQALRQGDGFGQCIVRDA